MEQILTLSKITEIFNDKEDLKEILMLLSNSIPEFLEEMDKSLNKEDFQKFKFSIHKFKSSSQLVTTPAFIEHIKTIENVKDIEELQLKVEKLKEMVLKLQQEIANEIQRYV